MQEIVERQISGWKSQIRKGTLELAVLSLLRERRHYGLELLERLNQLQLGVSDGSIYPLLARLRTEKKVVTEWVDAGIGHSHKYYALTPFGAAVLKGMVAAWRDYTGSINRALVGAKEGRDAIKS